MLQSCPGPFGTLRKDSNFQVIQTGTLLAEKAVICDLRVGRLNVGTNNGAQGATGNTGETGASGVSAIVSSECGLRTSPIDPKCGIVFGPLSGVTRTVNGPPGPLNYATIMLAITAAANGDGIVVFPGSYPEVVTFLGKNNIVLEAQTFGTVTINPPVLVPITKPVVSVNTAVEKAIQIRGLKVVPPSINPSGRPGTGISVTNGGSALLDQNQVAFDTTFPISGAQQGRGISIDTGGLAILNGNTVSEYQKTGIRINGTNTCSSLLNNTVIGVGPTATIAQNGIQIGRGAMSLVFQSAASQNNFTPTGTDSCGLLLVGPTDLLWIQSSSFFANNLGLATFDEGNGGISGALIQQTNCSNNTSIGFAVDKSSVGNVFIQNVALNNTTFDFFDETFGVFAGMTGNVYLCNACRTDNRGGQICDSTTFFGPTTTAPPVFSSVLLSRSLATSSLANPSPD